VGGTLFTGLPSVVTSFASVTQMPLVNGAASVTYEVLDASASVTDVAQIPAFIGVPAYSCSTPRINTLAATLAPVSTVSIASQTDPIPRYLDKTPPSDCTVLGDCAAPYFPVLQVAPTFITLNGSLQGQPQNGFITLTDGGA